MHIYTHSYTFTRTHTPERLVRAGSVECRIATSAQMPLPPLTSISPSLVRAHICLQQDGAPQPRFCQLCWMCCSILLCRVALTTCPATVCTLIRCSHLAQSGRFMAILVALHRQRPCSSHLGSTALAWLFS